MDKIFSDNFALLDQWKSLTDYFEEDKSFVSVGVVVSASIGSYLLVQQVKAWGRRKEKARKREEKREEKERSIQLMREKCQNVAKSEVDAILALNVTQLREAIISSKLKPVQVLRAYQTKALEAHDKTNCVIEFVDEAEAPPDKYMSFHHEMRYQDHVPDWVFFYCDIQPAEGGQTPVAMSYPIYEDMVKKEPEFVEKLAKEGVYYTRVQPGETDDSTIISGSWQSSYFTNNKDEIEEMVRSHGGEIEWLDNECARISCKLEAFGMDSITGKKTWFNNALAYYLGYANQWNDPKKTIFFGNGDPMPEKAMQTLREQWALECEGTDPAGRTLHGIPISIKEDLPIKGYDTTIGVASRAHKPCPDDSVVLKLMKKHGAIPYVRTNVPQLCLSYEGGNPIHGETRNPHDLSRGSGGSSSGEGAIIGFGASILGIGSDIGGSIRSPCHFSGVAGFKPTTTRMSTRGANCYCGDNYFQNYVAPTWGPLGRDVDTVISALRILLDGHSMNALDQTIAPVKFNDQVLSETRLLKIGYYEDNGMLTPVPAVTRAFNQAKTYLQRQGHTLVPFNIPQLDHCMKLMYHGLLADGGDQIAEYLKDDTHDPTLKSFADLKIPKCLRKMFAFLVQFTNPERADMLRILSGGRLLSYWDVACQIKAYRQQVSDKWRKMGLDALICPPFAFPATPLGSPVENFGSDSYMMPYNVLNFPAGIVPMTRVNEKDVREMAQYPTKDAKHKRVKELMEQTSTIGLPVGLQVVALSYNDEMALNVMKQCEKASNYKK